MWHLRQVWSKDHQTDTDYKSEAAVYLMWAKPQELQSVEVKHSGSGLICCFSAIFYGNWALTPTEHSKSHMINFYTLPHPLTGWLVVTLSSSLLQINWRLTEMFKKFNAFGEPHLWLNGQFTVIPLICEGEDRIICFLSSYNPVILLFQ